MTVGARNTPARMVIADPMPVVLEGLPTILAGLGRVVARAASLPDLEMAIRATSPDLVVSALIFPGEGNALSLLRRATVEIPGCRFVVFTAFESQALRLESYHAGAAAFVVKSSGPDVLREAVRAVTLRSDRMMPLAAPAHPRPRRRWREVHHVDGEMLTGREIAVLVALYHGNERNEIAERLGISPRTVEYHLNEARRRLGLTRFALLIRWVGENLATLTDRLNRV